MISQNKGNSDTKSLTQDEIHLDTLVWFYVLCLSSFDCFIVLFRLLDMIYMISITLLEFGLETHTKSRYIRRLFLGARVLF